ncbi:alpha/beta hydrolase family protein [Nannocystis radixulma]|uniref:Prolyl oligopeptidase family serine peptidase n=1 Tax=Nannocystis radixulma TaxID=2995305 RepID=A0ABT5BFL2_9BACT|nr:prolyl oligopeptidase family serine peptidase [Nannocystis radixulma]MDC0672935.1 prolyl oligopeptidase family serine peptidase [Nannocystis radixulma]
MRSSLALVVLAGSTGCIWSPNSLTTHESTASISLSGYTQGASKTVDFLAKNAETGALTWLSSAVSTTTPNPWDSTLFPWTKSLTPASTYWAPQVTYTYNSVQYTAHRYGPGRLELRAEMEGDTLYTYTEAAQDCWYDRFADGDTPTQAGVACADGQSLVLFDNSGVGSPAETTGWVQDTLASGTVYGASVQWAVGHYAVQGHTVHGLVCRPTAAGTYPVQIINHGGYGGLDNVVALATCQRAAARGWLVAMSAYRGEPMSGFPGVTVPGNAAEIEVCMGEVVDALRLTELARGMTGADPDRVLMWGHSHGGCITERAVEQGAPVVAAASFAAPTDFVAWHAYCGVSGVPCAGTPTDLQNGLGGPPGSAPAAYAWRSPSTFAADLAGRRDLKFLALQGTDDPIVYPSQACAFAKLTGATGWHVNAAGTVVTTAPAGPWTNGSCNTTPTTLTWSTGAVPGSTAGAWSAAQNLVVYDGMDHGEIVQSGIFAPTFPALRPWLDFENFVVSQGLPLP